MESHNGPPKRIAIGIAAAVLTAAAVIAVAVAIRPAQADDPSPAPNVGMCVEFYSLETLPNRDFAFDGTVADIVGDKVTFAVGETFLGHYEGAVTLTAVGASAVTTADGPQLEEGGRYLVAGDADHVWGCGFTQPYDEDTAQDWAEAAS